MKYLLDSERPIFLHFLNREAAEAARLTRTEEEDINALNVLTITHCSRFSVNISQMLEYTHDKPTLVKAVTPLIERGILITTSNDGNTVDFLDSRQRMYSKVPHRYPMYFKDTSLVEKIPITQKNTFSMTTSLRRDILDVKSTELALYARRAHDGDIERFRNHLEAIQRITYKERHQAITRANFAVFAKEDGISEQALDSAARMFSALYIEHYSELNGSVTCSGLRDVGYHDDNHYFPHYDVPILAVLLSALEWEQFATRTENLRGIIVAIYGAPEHRTFVEHVHAFLYATYRQVQQSQGNAKSSSRVIPTDREIVGNLVSNYIRECPFSPSSFPRDLSDFFRQSTDRLISIAKIAQTDQHFREAWEENMKAKSLMKILVLTSTDIEDDSLKIALLAAGYSLGNLIPAGQSYVQRYIKGRTREVLHTRSNAGSVGTSGSELTSSDVIVSLGVQFLIAVGICFGLKRDKSKIGDVLISEEVVDYEKVRVGEAETRERGPRIPAGPRLLSVSRAVRQSYDTANTGILERFPASLILAGGFPRIA